MIMSRDFALRIVVAFFAVMCSSDLFARRPNIVLILADDLGYETVGCYGGTSYPTPRLDQLAAEGLRFEHAYAMPLCTNTRIQLMTGKYNNRNWKAFGILDPNEDTFAHMLKRAGYKTCIAGKWQLTSYDPPDFPGAELRRSKGMTVQNAGYDEYSLWHTGHTEVKGSRYADPVINENGTLRTDTKGKYGPDLWVDFIGDFMTRHRDEPFFVYYPMALPHNPMNPTPDSPEWSDPEMRHRDQTRFAADMIQYTDKVVGKVVDKLDELKLRENTLVLFYSDNGTNSRVTSMMGSQRVRGEKGKGTELGIRVPMIASWKGKTPVGKVSDSLIDSVDFLPTVLQIAGASDEVKSPIDGISFADELAGGKGSPREWVYIHQDPRPGWDKDRFWLIRLARDTEYKLYEDGRLFNTRVDPFEKEPLFINADSQSERAARNRLQSVLDNMKPYPMFDPSVMPRPNPNDPIENNEFQDQGGVIVAEAEMLPTPRDESWISETTIPGYLAGSYIRSVRDQAKPVIGKTVIHLNANTEGDWSLAFRVRSDRADTSSEREFWVKVGESPWMTCRMDSTEPSGKWNWTDKLYDARTGNPIKPTFRFEEKRNDVWIAPKDANLKIDRIVAYESDQRSKALDLSTPVSAFHPWASPK